MNVQVAYGPASTDSARRLAPALVLAAAAVLLAAQLPVRFGPAQLPFALAGAGGADRSQQQAAEASEAYAQLPLSFVPNAGQTDAAVRYSAQAGGASFWFTSTEAVFSFAGKDEGVNLRLGFLGANPAPEIEGTDVLAGKVNYLLGNEPSAWKTGLPTYGELVYRELWPGIDLAFRGEAGTLKYEFRVAPGADPSDIRLLYRGADSLALGPAGDLLLSTALGTISDAAPVTYQIVEGRRVPVVSGYQLAGAAYGFKLGAYDPSRPLVIDPGLLYSTFLGGSSSDGGRSIAVDATGSAYLTGQTFSADFPTTAGALDTTHNGGFDAFVAKLNASGSALLYSTFLGGSAADVGARIAVDAEGSAYLTGETSSAGFPTTAGALDTTHNGATDAFVTKLNASGSDLLYSTFLGGGGSDSGAGITIDASGSAHVTGPTGSAGFPTTSGTLDTTHNGGTDAFVTKLNASGSDLLYSTFLGGGAPDVGVTIAVDAAGSAYLTGSTQSADFPTTSGTLDTTHNGSFDAFVTKLNASGSELLYSTFLGDSSLDIGRGIAADAAGSAYLTGETSSADFPTTAGALDTSYNGGTDAFVTKLNASGSVLTYSTFLGGSATDLSAGIAVDAAGSAYLTGLTSLPADFPTTAGALDTTHNGGFDAFVTKLNASGSALVYSTYLGGSGSDLGLGIAVDAAGNAYLTGETNSADFPTTSGALDTTHNGGNDTFVTKLDLVPFFPPAAITLSPASATNSVGTSHTVTATVKDAADPANPVPDLIVRFTVTGSVPTTGSCTTDSNGQCNFTYNGPSLPGADLISAYADTDGDGVQDTGEPVAVPATKAWVLPTSTAGQASGGGHFADAVWGKVVFGFSAKSEDGSFQGQCNVIDPGNRMIKCLDVTALVISGNEATIYGNATDNGTATTYVMKARDVADPGKGADTFSITTAGGYSASGTLTAGNIQVEP
jgi:hypothetical protein